MYPTTFEYLVPKDLKEAVELAGRYGEEAKFLAGGQSLVPLMKLRLARPRYLIDLNGLGGLNGIREEDGLIRCGAMCRHVEMEESELLRGKIPLVCEAAGHIGDMQVRNRGTLGGALAEADPAGDWGPVILALKARLRCVGPRGEREIMAEEFFTFPYTTALQEGEMLSEVIFPLPAAGAVGVYMKLERVAGDFAIASVALQIGVDPGGVCRAIGMGVTGAGPVPQKALSVEGLLLGKKMTPELIEEAGRLVEEGADPLEDLRGSAAYKKKTVGVLVKRALLAGLQGRAKTPQR